MKIYTKSGDHGKTSLVSGERVSKADVVVEAYGTIDELNSFLGVLIEACAHPELKNEFQFIQNLLFNIGSIIAKGDFKANENYPQLSVEHTIFLENRIDEYTSKLAPLKQFILPGGSNSAAWAHVCRSVCRRAERRICMIEEPTDEILQVIVFVNRLSDYFFTVSRYLLFLEERQEIFWNSKHDLSSSF